MKFLSKQILIIILILSWVNIFSQSGWFWQNPLSSGNYIYYSKFVNNNIGFAMGYESISKTTDGGINWFSLPHPDSLTGVACVVNENIIYSMSGHGKILKSTNGGINWSIQTINPALNGYQISFINENTGYALLSLSSYYLYKTTNGGNNWNQISQPTGNIYRMRFFNESIGFTVGADGFINKTTNGGVTWFSQGSASPYDLNDICSVDINTFYICGEFGRIQKTTNGGLTWFSQSSSVGSDLRCIIAEGNYGIAVGDHGAFTATGVGGDIWADLSISHDPEFNFYSAASPDLAVKGNLFGSGGLILNYSGGSYTINNNFYANLWDVCFPDSLHGFAVGDKGKIAKTTNGGNNWISVSYDTSYNFHSAYFINSNTGFCTSYYFSPLVLLKTTNAGLTWQNNPQMDTNAISSVFFTDVNNGYACSHFGKIYKTTNTGSNWTQVFNNGGDLGKIKFAKDNPSIGYACGGNGIYKTTNSGLNWFFQNSGITTSVESFSIVNSNIVYAMGGTFAVFNVYRTTNGGLNWSVANSTNLGPGSGIFFIDQNTGFLATDNILRTTNGGNTWTSQFFGSFNSIYFTSFETGYSVGGLGQIVKTTSGGIPIGIQLTNSEIPQHYNLHQNYPNPFNPTSIIKFELPKSSNVTIKIFDILGREVETLVNEYKTSGNYEIQFDASQYSSGIYFYMMEAGDFVESKKMVLIK